MKILLDSELLIKKTMTRELAAQVRWLCHPRRKKIPKKQVRCSEVMHANYIAVFKSKKKVSKNRNELWDPEQKYNIHVQTCITGSV